MQYSLPLSETMGNKNQTGLKLFKPQPAYADEKVRPCLILVLNSFSIEEELILSEMEFESL